MNKVQKQTLCILIALAIGYFIAFYFPNVVGAADRHMIAVFEPDESVQYNTVMPMVRAYPTFKDAVIEFLFYEHFFYGFPFFSYSGLLLLPIRWFSNLGNPQINILVLRQMVSVFPMLVAITLLVYLQTRFQTRLKSTFLFLFLLSIPAVTRNSLWWHPESLTILFIVLVFFFLDRDRLKFSVNFWMAAVACGFAIGTKLIGLYFFLTIPTYILWGFAKKEISIKKVFQVAVVFLGVMLFAIWVSNPILIFESARNSYLETQIKQAGYMAFGFEIGYSKGPSSWFDLINEFYGGGIFIIVAVIALLKGILRGPNHLLHTLIFSYALPFTLYILFAIAIKPFHFFLPVVLPVYSSIAVIIPDRISLNATIKSIREQRSKLWKFLPGVIALLAIAFQFVGNIAWGVEYYTQELHREEHNDSVSFFRNIENQYLSKLPDEREFKVYRDVRLYVPNSEQWKTFSKFAMLDYEYMQARNPDFIFLIKQRLADYTTDNAIAYPADPVQMEKSLPFYTDAKAGILDGYTLLYENHYGMAFVRNDIYEEFFAGSGD